MTDMEIDKDQEGELDTIIDLIWDELLDASVNKDMETIRRNLQALANIKTILKTY